MDQTDFTAHNYRNVTDRHDFIMNEIMNSLNLYFGEYTLINASQCSRTATAV